MYIIMFYIIYTKFTVFYKFKNRLNIFLLDLYFFPDVGDCAVSLKLHDPVLYSV